MGTVRPGGPPLRAALLAALLAISAAQTKAPVLEPEPAVDVAPPGDTAAAAPVVAGGGCAVPERCLSVSFSDPPVASDPLTAVAADLASAAAGAFSSTFAEDFDEHVSDALGEGGGQVSTTRGKSSPRAIAHVVEGETAVFVALHLPPGEAGGLALVDVELGAAADSAAPAGSTAPADSAAPADSVTGLGSGPLSARVNAQLWEALEGVYGGLLKDAKSALGGGKRLFLTGFGLGGALAHLAAARLAGEGDAALAPAGVYSFGAPRAGAAPSWPAAYEALGLTARTFRFYYHKDIVPQLPPRGGGG
jgi:hypothetical protein